MFIIDSNNCTNIDERAVVVKTSIMSILNTFDQKSKEIIKILLFLSFMLLKN